jgi:hypothetical protein
MYIYIYIYIYNSKPAACAATTEAAKSVGFRVWGLGFIVQGVGLRDHSHRRSMSSM